jgi:hypothetical protein
MYLQDIVPRATLPDFNGNTESCQMWKTLQTCNRSLLSTCTHAAADLPQQLCNAPITLDHAVRQDNAVVNRDVSCFGCTCLAPGMLGHLCQTYTRLQSTGGAAPGTMTAPFGVPALTSNLSSLRQCTRHRLGLPPSLYHSAITRAHASSRAYLVIWLYVQTSIAAVYVHCHTSGRQRHMCSWLQHANGAGSLSSCHQHARVVLPQHL